MWQRKTELATYYIQHILRPLHVAAGGSGALPVTAAQQTLEQLRGASGWRSRPCAFCAGGLPWDLTKVKVLACGHAYHDECYR